MTTTQAFLAPPVQREGGKEGAIPRPPPFTPPSPPPLPPWPRAPVTPPPPFPGPWLWRDKQEEGTPPLSESGPWGRPAGSGSDAGERGAGNGCIRGGCYFEERKGEGLGGYRKSGKRGPRGWGGGSSPENRPDTKGGGEGPRPFIISLHIFLFLSFHPFSPLSSLA